MTEVRGSAFIFAAVLFTLHGASVWAIPTFLGVPATRYIPEFTSDRTLMYIFNMTENDAFPSTCNMSCMVSKGTGTMPETGMVELVYNTDSWTETQLQVWALAGVEFEIDKTNISELTCYVICTDKFASTDPIEVKFEIVAGEQIWFDGFTDTIRLSCEDVTATEFIDVIEAMSTLNHEFNYGIEVYPKNMDNPYFVIDKQTGIIRANRDLIEFDTGQATSMDLWVRAYDEHDGVELIQRIKILLEDQNTLPYSKYLRTIDSWSFSESWAAGVELFNLDGDDANNDPIDYTFDCTPEVCKDIFELSAGGSLKIKEGQQMDYESIRKFDFDFYLSDQKGTTAALPFELIVTDSNDAPECPITSVFITIDEGAKGTSFDPDLQCTDEDGESLTWSTATSEPSSLFTITSSTAMSFATNYDVDNGVHSSTATVIAYCSDSGGPSGEEKSCSVTVTVVVNDINDNAPQFPNNAYRYEFDQTCSAGTTIGDLNPTDADSSFGAPTCDTYEDAYIKLNQDCTISCKSNSGLQYGNSISFTATVRDSGGLSDTAAVDVVYVEKTTTTVTTTTATTTTEENILDNPAVQAMLAMLAIMGAILLGLLGWCLARVCCGCCQGGTGFCDCCNRTGRTKMPPPRVYPSSRPPPYSYQPTLRHVVVKQVPTNTKFQQTLMTVAKPPSRF